jgi:hypothetical protein
MRRRQAIEVQREPSVEVSRRGIADRVAACRDDARHRQRMAPDIARGGADDGSGARTHAGFPRGGQRAAALQPDAFGGVACQWSGRSGAGSLADQGVVRRGVGRGGCAIRHLPLCDARAAMPDRGVGALGAIGGNVVSRDGARFRGQPQSEAWLQMRIDSADGVITQHWRRVVAKPF